jgi:preprotein translocase subunit SecA
VLDLAEKNISGFIDSQEELEYPQISRYILNHISYSLDERLERRSYRTPEQKKRLADYLLLRVKESLREQEEKLGSEKHFSDFMRVAALKAIDEAWVEQVDYLQQLQAAVSGRTSAQRNPVYEYQREALVSFTEMKETILEDIMRNILLSNVYLDAQQKVHILLP